MWQRMGTDHCTQNNGISPLVSQFSLFFLTYTQAPDAGSMSLSHFWKEKRAFLGAQ